MNQLFLKVLAKLQSLVEHEDGQDMIEYALVVALISLGVVASVRSFAAGVAPAFVLISTQFSADI